MPDTRPTISTHVLDTGAGRPGAGVRVRLWRIEAPSAEDAGGGVTDVDGRIADLLDGQALRAGRYRLEFELGEGRFFEAVTLDVRIDDVTRSHHVPLLVAPFGVSSYRGS